MTTAPATTPLTADRLAEIRQRAEAATPGHWASGRDLNGVYSVEAQPRITPGFVFETEGDVARIINDSGNDTQASADAWFIAQARTDIPALLDEVDRLRNELTEARTSTLTTAADKLDRIGHNAAAWILRDDAKTEEGHVVDYNYTSTPGEAPECIDDCPGCEAATA